MIFKKGISIISLMLFLCLTLVGCGSNTTVEPVQSLTLEDYNNEIVIDTTNTEKVEEIVEPEVSETNISENENSIDTTSANVLLDEIIVKFIDVGQADGCLIITANNDAILIDTGEKRDAEAVLSVLNEYELEDIDLLVLTHPHADHIGGAKTILETYKVEEVLMCSFVATSKLFENLLTTLESQDLVVTQATVGHELSIDGVDIQVVGVDSKPNDNNNSSIVLKITYGTVDMLFTGDAEEPAEEVILSNGYDLSAEILKVGHHGSDTSTSEAFLDAISPKVAIISCGVDNKYNHPADITLKKLSDRGIQCYRTDELGTITLEIDGKDIVTSIEDNFETVNFRSGSFIYTPNVAEIELELESVVIENQESKKSEN